MWLSGPERNYHKSRAKRTGYDLSQNEVKNYVDEDEKRKNRTKSRVRQGGMAVPHVEARFRIYEGALSRHQEQS
jgi:predicted ABC-type ATPase